MYYFGKFYEEVFKESLLLKYLQLKTKSVTKSSKSRASYGNLFALYVLVEDYLSKKLMKAATTNLIRGLDFLHSSKDKENCLSEKNSKITL